MDLLTLNWEDYVTERTADERCGVVLKTGEIIELMNESSYPLESYVMSTASVEPYKQDMIATWHTHPRGPGNLSIDDYNTFLELSYLSHLIISPKTVSIYKAEGDYVMALGRRFLNV